MNVNSNEVGIDNTFNSNVAYQSAMYKSPKEKFSDFYNQVFEKENDAKANNTTVKKSYFQYNNNGLSVRIPHDTVNHSDKKHNLSGPEWTDVLNNILNIENAGISKTQYSNDNVALLKISTPNGKYGVSIQFANGTNQISTVFKSTDKGIDEWIEKGSANSSTSEPLTSRDKSHTVAVVSQNLNNIISYVKQKLNPTEFINNNIKENFGYSAEELENNFKSDIKNILEENGVDYDEFEIEDIKLYGSYTTGKNKDTSDLDVIVQYKGSMREDSAFDLLNSEKLTIVDVNGIEREVDINPINSALSGTIKDHIEYMNELEPRFQSAITTRAETPNEDEKNLLMTHAMKSNRLDDVIESGGLVAPSFAITKKDMQGDALNKFGDILFIRNLKKIDFQNDNIYDRDIYSPRIPQPWYDIPNGRIVDGYEYESLKRNYESNPEKFVEKWGKTFDEMFKSAKKVLNLGFTPSGNHKFVPYTNENILKEMKKQGLLNKEGFDYGLSSLLSRFSTQKKDLKSLKETAKNELGSTANLDEKYEQINKEYEELGEKLAPLYYDKWSFYEFQSDVFYAIAKNKKKYLKDTYNIEVPAELEKEVKEFVEKAKSLPRSYFEAKPMREVDLSEFSYAIAEKGVISDKQKKALKDKGVKVIEYNHGEKEGAIKKLQTETHEVYFQSAKVGSVNNSEKYKNLPQNLKDAVDYIFNGKPVYNITGEEFPNNGENLNERINKYYKDNFDNKIKVDSIGEIKLDKRSIKDSIYHGINADKVNAFKAVPHVIKNGKSLDVSKPQNNGELRYLFVAPITLKGEDYYCEVVVKSNKDRQGFYIHEVELKEKLADVFSTAHHGTSTSSKSIIANLVNNFNPTTYKQEIQPSLFEGNNKAREIHKVKGSFMPAEKIIELFKNADIYDVIINKKC